MFAEGAGFEPTMFKGTLAITIHIIKRRACLRPLGQPSKYVYPDCSLFLDETSEPRGWLGKINTKCLTKNPMKRCTQPPLYD